MTILYFFPALGIIWIGISIWQFVDSRKRSMGHDGMFWFIASLFFLPLSLPIYLAYRPLLQGESRYNGYWWNVCKNLGISCLVAGFTFTLAGLFRLSGSAETQSMFNRLLFMGPVISLASSLFFRFLGSFLKKPTIEEYHLLD